MNNLMDGVSGLVLAAETAIGDNPIKSVRVINDAVTEFYKYSSNQKLKSIQKNQNNKASWRRIEVLKSLDNDYDNNSYKIEINYFQLLDFFKSLMEDTALRWFLNQEETDSVLKYNRFNQTVWTVPIILQIKKFDYENIIVGDRVNIIYKTN